jgi:hypothetical protein
MAILEEFKKIAENIPAEIKEEKKKYVLEYVVAERKSFLSKKKLIYKAQFKIDEEKKEVRFTEMLKESGFGFSSGGMDDMSPGVGFKSGTYKIGMSGEREGTIEEQSDLFGKKYNYKFDLGKIRNDFKRKTEEAGYGFVYKITSWGL